MSGKWITDQERAIYAALAAYSFNRKKPVDLRTIRGVAGDLVGIERSVSKPIKQSDLKRGYAILEQLIEENHARSVELQNQYKHGYTDVRMSNEEFERYKTWKGVK